MHKIIRNHLILLFILIFSNCSLEKFPWDNYTVEEAVDLSEGKLIMIDFYADWCTACHHLDTSTFSNKDVISFCTENFINLKINTDTDYGYKMYEKFNVTSLPTIIFLDSDGTRIRTINGYHSPENYLKIIKSSF